MVEETAANVVVGVALIVILLVKKKVTIKELKLSRPQNDFLFGPINKENDRHWSKFPEINNTTWWDMQREDYRKLFWPGSNIPNVQRNLFGLYTRKGDMILDPFFGGGTTGVVCYEMNREFIATDLVPADKFHDDMKKYPWYKGIANWAYYHLSATDKDYTLIIKQQLEEYKKNYVDFIFWHPPYHNIIEYHKEVGVEKSLDLSALSYPQFLEAMNEVFFQTMPLLKIGGYSALLIGDKSVKGQWHTMGFDVMKEALKYDLILKSVVVKNMAGNEAKGGPAAILQRSRDLRNGSLTFRHEYIFIFEKDR